MIKKKYYGNECFCLAWHRIKVCQIAPFITTIMEGIKLPSPETWNCYLKINS